MNKVSARARISSNSEIQADHIIIEDDVIIEDGVKLIAKYVRLRRGTHIQRNTEFIASKGPEGILDLGEQVTIWHDGKFVVPALILGNYTTIFNNALYYGKMPICIGHNCWIGRFTIMNSEERITVGNGVGMGSQTELYTHGFWGELIEGCLLDTIAPVVVEDDVWFLGNGTLVNPGVTIGTKTMIMPKSTVTKSLPAQTVWGGSPCKELTEKIEVYKPVDIGFKLEKMKEFVAEFAAMQEKHEKPGDDIFKFTDDQGDYFVCVANSSDDLNLPAIKPFLEERCLLFSDESNSHLATGNENITFFNLDTKTYNPSIDVREKALIRFLFNKRARFVPEHRRHVGLEKSMGEIETIINSV